MWDINEKLDWKSWLVYDEPNLYFMYITMSLQEKKVTLLEHLIYTKLSIWRTRLGVESAGEYVEYKMMPIYLLLEIKF